MNEPIEIFPLTRAEDTHEEAALKIANALRQFGEADLAEELEACAGQDRENRDEYIIDILDDAIGRLFDVCPSSLELRFFEDGESGFLEAERSTFNGYAFVSRKESRQIWEQMWPEEVKNEALRGVDEAQRKRHDPDA